jgi:hypothetical protein
MAELQAISGNKTQLSIAVESSIGVLPGTPVWTPYEPNGYDDVGGEITTAPRKPIKSDRMGRKGPVVDVEAKAGFNSDLTYSNMFSLLEGYLYSVARRKVEKINANDNDTITAVTAATETFTVDADGDDFLANDLVLASGFTNSANNALFTVASSTTTTVVVDADVTVDETPPTNAKLIVVGHEFASGDAEILTTSGFPTLITTPSTGKDLTQLGILPGETVYIGGDLTAEKFATAANNGYARVRSVTANEMVFDKTQGTMVTDAGAGKTIRIFLGRLLKNEVGSLIVRKTFQIERQLGAPNDTYPSAIQAEYVTGAVCSELALNIPEAEKITVDASFMGLNHETSEAAGAVTGLKAGTRPALVAEDAFNSSSSVPRIKINVVSSTNSNPAALFAQIGELTLTINNNLSRNLAIGTTGAFEMSEGDFGVQLELEAFFANLSALASVRSNSDLTVDFSLYHQNQGISFDIPLLAGSGALANVEADSPIKLPLTSEGANGIDVASTLNHILAAVFFDYLPTAAGA